ncbi:MAG: helix-turn-helix transcriptional regulator [Chloroflexi bacterium]|nr:helix-turn-helix transcriptional regulator [Chloroflexota bacterium]
MRRAAAQRTECAATAALNVLGQKWVMRIIRALGDRTQRFCELQDALGGANSATLSQRLKLLEDEALVERREVSVVPPWVEYSLTDKGSELRDAIAGIDGWAERWSARQ